MWLPCTVRYRVSCLHTTRKLHTEAIIWYVFYIMEYSLVKEAYQTVMWHGHVPIWYAYAYHTMHTICFSMWYATTHDILHVSSYLTLYVLTLIMAQGRRYSSVGKSSISLRVRIPVGAWLGPPNAWMRGEGKRLPAVKVILHELAYFTLLCSKSFINGIVGLSFTQKLA